ncbi:MAG: TRAM domain-containing protein [Acidobacteriota bacterium]|nr:TRAM domain-containing protein [Acidobacteriota bacterium]
MKRGDLLTLTIERPAAGGRMIARHEGAIVFVAGAIPGEVVDAEVEKVQRGTGWAITREVTSASPDRLADAPDGACGGSVLAHIRYERQLELKIAIVEDTLRRLGRITLDARPPITGSPVDGYRMRARLHVRNRRIGFFREGTHSLCDAAQTRQLHPRAIDMLRSLETSLATLERDPVSEIELSENIDASERAVHFELVEGGDPSRLATITNVAGLMGASCAPPDSRRTQELWGSTTVADTIGGVRLERHARSFFQGNRFLLQPLVDHVLSQITGTPVLDLYAGVGLFSVTAAAAGRGPVTAIEGDRFAAADLRRNAAERDDVAVEADAVENYLKHAQPRAGTVILDPPRTGLSKAALAGAIAVRAPRLVYVSCDVATLARDARSLIDSGYEIASVRAFDLFPTTAHVETVIAFSRSQPR